MPKEATLARIEGEIAEGRLGIARDRLHGLVVTYPEELSLRSRLAEVYWRLGYPIPAGEYWFLDPEPGEHGPEAIQAFLRDCGGDPKVVLKRLRLPPDLAGVRGYARQRVDELIEEYRRRYQEEPDLQKPASNSGGLSNRGCGVLGLACSAVVVLILALAVFGLGELVKRLF